MKTASVAIVVALTTFALWLGPAAPALSKTYANAAYGFSLKVPADFSAYPPDASPVRDSTGALTGQAIVLKNAAGAAVQIVATMDTRSSPSNILTVEDIEQQAPYLDLSKAQPVQIAPGVTGVTFTNKGHPAYGTATDEVWFAYRGNLYQVMADSKDRALFESMIATWTFL